MSAAVHHHLVPRLQQFVEASGQVGAQLGGGRAEDDFPAAAPLARRASQSNPASYVSQISDEQPMRVTKDSEVRLRIMGTRVDATEIFAIGTIKDEYLGLLQPS